MYQRIKVIIIGPFPLHEVHGGICSVISSHLSFNLGDKYDIIYIHTSCKGNVLQKFFCFLISIFKLIHYIARLDISMLHIHTGSWKSFYRKSIYVFIGKVLRKKIILHIHGAEFNVFYSKSNGISRNIITKVLDCVDLILVLSQRWVNDIGIKTKNKKIKILFNPVNTSLFSPQKKNRESINIIFVGTLSKRKGIDDLLIAIPLVIKKVPSAHFTLCGNGDIDEFRRICKKQSISNHVTFTGWVNGQEKIDYIRNSDVFVLPSYNEGLPVSLIEAMSTGLPIISTPVGGIPDIFEEGVNGFLVQPGDIAGIANRLIRLLKDRSLRNKMGKKNANRARELFDVNVVMKKLCQIYKETLEMQS